jgi:Zn-dependent metalloprotease
VHASKGEQRFIRGKLGKLNIANDIAIANSAKQSLKDALSTYSHAKGTEKLNLVRINKNKKKNNIHVRFQQEVNGMPVEGTSLTVNSDPIGNTLAINGEFCGGDAVAAEPNLSAEASLAKALEEYGQGGSWIGTPKLTVVFSDLEEKCVLAWKNLLEYSIEEGPGVGLHRDSVFADATTGALVTFHPQIKGAASVMTYDCMGGTTCKSLVGNSSIEISTGDTAIKHNFALATYNYYWKNFGRDSIDDNGMTLKSRVHYKISYSNAFWDGSQMVRVSQIFERLIMRFPPF